MSQTPPPLRVAMVAWEIGRADSGLGVKIGGLGTVMEELPQELVKTAARQGLTLEIELLTPCFAHYDKSRLTKRDQRFPATLDGHTFEFDTYEHVFPDGQRVIYFWDEGQLHWTNARAIYPDDPQMALRLYASVSQAMAGYIRQGNFNTVHLHDYHVGLIPFYLGDDFLRDVPVHFTIHNASYQGITPLTGGGYESLDRINLPGWKLFHKYFDFFDTLNPMKACMLKVHELGGKITTVSGDIAGTWGYAAELRESHASLWARAHAQKGSPPGAVFLPNRHLDLFEKLPIAGITNGLSDRNRPENLPELQAETLRAIQAQRGTGHPIFRNPTTQMEMLARDHNFDLDRLHVKQELKHLLHLEAFDAPLPEGTILLSAVGRLVEQKNLGLVAEIAEWVLGYDGGVKFVILASAPEGDPVGQTTESHFRWLAQTYPDRVYFNHEFNLPLSKLILAGSDFVLIPSRFEPCGLVDYEASLLGTVVIGRLTGGLAKVRHCAYLYEWLDVSDREGEKGAFFEQIRQAIDVYRHDPGRHDDLRRRAMMINASWESSCRKYLDMYRYGFLAKQWHREREHLLEAIQPLLTEHRALFSEFFMPARDEYGDPLDWALRDLLSR